MLDGVSKLYLAHHGILGMKWGIRRYQNEDGSLTSAGRARYGSDVTKVSGRTLRKQAHKLISYQFKNSNPNSERVKTFQKYTDLAAEIEKKKSQSRSSTMSTAQQLEYLDDANKFSNEFFNEAAGALLRDLGYEDTRAGRLYAQRFLNEY